ncbi:glutamate receptor 2-like [Dreissena polymorpha]|nr:glutamate receptor 2-like [Dreissena polymorpha]
MADGVFLFFGVKDTKSLDIVQSFTRTFHMPYLSPSTSVWTEKSAAGFEVHMKPDYTFAIIDMILYFGWTKIHYVYDSDEGLQHIQMVLSALRDVSESGGSDSHVHVLARRIYNVENAHDELRQLDRMDPDVSTDKVIVFDLSSEFAYRNILRQIPEVGMNKGGYQYLIATLDFAHLDMRRYMHGGVNITGFQLIDLQSKHLEDFMKDWGGADLGRTYPGVVPDKLTTYEKRTNSRDRTRDLQVAKRTPYPLRYGDGIADYEAALAVDAIHVISQALRGMVKSNSKIFQSTFRRGMVYNYNRTKGIPCTTQPPVPWMHGEAIMEQIKMLDFEGLTGRIKFNEDGFRTDYKMDVYTVGLDSGPLKIGHWSSRDRFKSLFRNEEDLIIENKKKPKIVVSILSPPFLMEKTEDKSGKPLVGNAKYEGYVMDLTEKVMTEMNRFEYYIKEVEDRQYGSYIPQNNSWNGMVGELLTKKADVAIAPLTILYDREKVVDFSKPFMNFGISIMIKKPEIVKPGVFSFMEPLEMKIWICIVFAYCSVSVGLFLVGRFSPFEWQNSNAGPDDNHFGIQNALWFSMGALMLQGNDACPRSISGRVIGTCWWFFVLIIISSYTANLAAFLTIERMFTPINSADDLSVQTDIKYGTLSQGSSFDFFMKSKVPTYQRMYNYMTANPSVFVNDVNEGIERVKKSKGKYAFLLESPTNEYVNSREPCDTMKVGPNLNSKAFGIATAKNSPLSEQMNLAVLMLMEEGVLPKLKIKWWKDKGVCGNEGKDSSGKRELSLSNVAGVFYILVGGLAIAVVIASLEFLCSKTRLLETVKRTNYMKATETVTTLLSASMTERENGDLDSRTLGASNHTDRQETSFNYSTEPPCIGFEQFTRSQTEL